MARRFTLRSICCSKPRYTHMKATEITQNGLPVILRGFGCACAFMGKAIFVSDDEGLAFYPDCAATP